MLNIVSLRFTDDEARALREAAAREGQSLEGWAEERLRRAAPTSDRRAEGLERLLRHAGAIDLGRPLGVDNPGIDADLAREYGSSHEEPVS